MKGKFILSILVCLLCLTFSDKEGYFTISNLDKSWKLVLNESNNAKKLAHKIKEEGSINLTFIHDDINERYKYEENPIFGFEQDYILNEVEPYEIYIFKYYNINSETIYIIYKRSDTKLYGTKIGNLKDGFNKLNEFDSSLCKEDNNSGKCQVIFTIAYVVEPETDIVEPETDIVEPEADIIDPKININCKFQYVIELLIVIILLCVLIYMIK